MLFVNATLLVIWARVLIALVLYSFVVPTHDDETDDWCVSHLTPAVHLAVIAGFWEVVNAIVGTTRSHPLQVGLFASVRWGIEYLVTPLLPLGCLQRAHLWTVLCWSLGDTIRFACFTGCTAVEYEWCSSSSSSLAKPPVSAQTTTTTTTSQRILHAAKWIRYTAGPILFPLGVIGEVCMLGHVAVQGGRPYLWILILGLWPLGFFTLLTQLLHQRRKFLESMTTSVEPTTPVSSSVATGPAAQEYNSTS